MSPRVCGSVSLNLSFSIMKWSYHFAELVQRSNTVSSLIPSKCSIMVVPFYQSILEECNQLQNQVLMTLDLERTSALTGKKLAGNKYLLN